MQKKSLAALTAVGLAVAIAIPTIAYGNARRNVGSLNYLSLANTPFLARLAGANEVPPTAGDGDGAGVAAITFDVFTSGATTIGEVCWDLSYSGLNVTQPGFAAFIHQGAAGTSSPALVTIDPGTLGPTSATGCGSIDPAVVTLIRANPANYYVNLNTTEFPTGAIRGQLAEGPPPAGEAHLLPVPLRAYDSRDADGRIALNTTRTISLAFGKDATNTSVIAVPPGATAAIVTLTVTDTVGAGGFLKLYSAALVSPPSTSSINWSGAGQNLAVTTQVAVDSAGKVKVTDGANPTNFLIDVVGFLF